MERKAVLGVVGCGLIALGQHLPNIEKCNRIHLKWCCDINENNLKQAAERFKPERITSDYNELINDPEVDGIVVLTTHDVRQEIILKAARQGKHIFVEKPMSTSSYESYEIMKAIREWGVKLVVCFNRRCAPSVLDMMNIYRKHKENPKNVPWRFVREPEKYVPIREEENTMMIIRINDDMMSYRSYAFDEFIGHGTVIGEMCHYIDLACYIMGREPVKVYAEGWSRVNAIISLVFDDLSIANIFQTGNGSLDHPKELIEVYHKGASLQLDNYMNLRIAGIFEERDREYPLQNDPCHHINTSRGTQLYIDKMQERNRRIIQGEKLDFISPDKGHSKMLDKFVDCILDNAPSPCDELDGARATLVSMKAVESIRLGLPVKISEDEYNFRFA